jgi:hypothetical protein
MQMGYSIQMLSEGKRESCYYEVLTPVPSSRIRRRCCPIPFFRILNRRFSLLFKIPQELWPTALFHLDISIINVGCDVQRPRCRSCPVRPRSGTDHVGLRDHSIERQSFFFQTQNAK